MITRAVVRWRDETGRLEPRGLPAPNAPAAAAAAAQLVLAPAPAAAQLVDSEAAGTSCRSPDRPTCPNACCARWRRRPSTTAAQAEGLDAVFARHGRHAEATRRAVRAWGLELLCVNPAEYSSSLTAVLAPEGHDAGRLLDVVLDRFDMALGVGLGVLAGKVFRIGHLGDFNDLSLIGTLAGVEMGLALAGVPHRAGGVGAAMTHLAERARSAAEPVPA